MNIKLKETIQELKKISIEKKVPLWKRVATELEKSNRRRRIVNLTRINIHTKEGETILVPGKVLATGELDHKVSIVAWKFSQEAMIKIKKAKGDIISLEDFMKKEIKGRKVRIIG
jgi:large subunit ribosomal protein L18e